MFPKLFYFPRTFLDPDTIEITNGGRDNVIH